ncbi:MAG: transcriptional repressor LexA [Bdellovibrio sp.]
MPPQPLTEKEKQVLEFVEKYILLEGLCPTYREIKDHFRFASFNSVQNYLRQLQAKGYVELTPHARRALQIKSSSQSQVLELKRLRQENTAPPSRVPLLGKVAAGLPLEAYTNDEFVEAPPEMVKDPQTTYALQVSGLSMRDEGILDGDILIIRKRDRAENGDLVIASIDQESTVKRFFLRKRMGEKWIELRPANSEHQSQWFKPDRVRIQGQVIGLLRQYS